MADALGGMGSEPEPSPAAPPVRKRRTGKADRADRVANSVTILANFGAIQLTGRIEAAMDATEYAIIQSNLAEILEGTNYLAKAAGVMNPAMLAAGLAFWGLRVYSLYRETHAGIGAGRLIPFTSRQPAPAPAPARPGPRGPAPAPAPVEDQMTPPGLEGLEAFERS